MCVVILSWKDRRQIGDMCIWHHGKKCLCVIAVDNAMIFWKSNWFVFNLLFFLVNLKKKILMETLNESCKEYRVRMLYVPGT